MQSTSHHHPPKYYHFIKWNVKIECRRMMQAKHFHYSNCEYKKKRMKICGRIKIVEIVNNWKKKLCMHVKKSREREGMCEETIASEDSSIRIYFMQENFAAFQPHIFTLSPFSLSDSFCLSRFSPYMMVVEAEAKSSSNGCIIIA